MAEEDEMGRILDVQRIPLLRSICKRIDREGEAFFEGGRAMVEFLSRLALALKQRRIDELPLLYDPGFAGKKLGLTEFAPGAERDGIRHVHLRSAPEVATAESAIDEW